MPPPTWFAMVRAEAQAREARVVNELVQAHRDNTATEAFMRSRVASIASIRWLLDDLAKKFDAAEPQVTSLRVPSHEGALP